VTSKEAGWAGEVDVEQGWEKYSGANDWSCGVGFIWDTMQCIQSLPTRYMVVSPEEQPGVYCCGEIAGEGKFSWTVWVLRVGSIGIFESNLRSLSPPNTDVSKSVGSLAGSFGSVQIETTPVRILLGCLFLSVMT
jgi:hypothetical protein